MRRQSLCVAVDSLPNPAPSGNKFGDVITSTNPAGGLTAWTATEIDPNYGLTTVSCTTAELCVVGDARGEVLVSQDPAAGSSAWTGSVVSGANALTALSCVGGLCAGGDIFGAGIESNDPVLGPWQATTMPVASPFDWVLGESCPTQQLCVAVTT